MTMPIAGDYPDHGRYSARASKLYVDAASTSTTVALILLSAFVGDISYLGLRLFMTTEPATFEVAFYADAGQTITLGVTSIDVNAGGQFIGSIPVAGPYLRVRRILNGANANTATYTIFEAASLFHANHGSPANNILANTTANPIAAGATEIIDTTRTWPGEAQFFASMDAIVWHVDVLSRDRSGTNRLLARFSQSTPEQTQTLFLPPTPIRIEIVNGDGSAHEYNLSLTARPLYPGV